jgi:hypothetical protein
LSCHLFLREFSAVSQTLAANLLTQKLGKKVGRKGFYCCFTACLLNNYRDITTIFGLQPRRW